MPSTETEEELRNEFLLTGIATGPAKPDEIDALEQSLGIQLPTAYRAYLRVCGTHPPHSLVGSDCVMHQIADINTWGAELIAENNVAPKFPERYFVYLMHQGYTFLWSPWTVLMIHHVIATLRATQTPNRWQTNSPNGFGTLGSAGVT